jgi:hypothetical protein
MAGVVKAANFFGHEGEQLEEKKRNACRISFEGNGAMPLYFVTS